MASDTKAQHLASAIGQAFPSLSSTARLMLAKAIVRFVMRATEKRWNLENEFDLSGLRIDRGTELSHALKQLRGNMSLERVAAATRWSKSKILRIEAGDVGISVTDMLFLLDLYGCKDTATREKFLALNHADRKARR